MPGDLATRVEEAVFTYTFQNTRPIELLDLTTLLAIGEQYQRFMREQGDGSADDYRLYVREARTGSIVIDLVACVTQPNSGAADTIPHSGYQRVK